MNKTPKQTRQFFTLKFKSSRLKEFNYDINLTFDDAKDNNEVISLFDSQILRSIRDITNNEIDYEHLEDLHSRRDSLRKKRHSEDIAEEIHQLQDSINEILYIPEYVTIVMDYNSHYDYLYKHGLKLNGKVYRRFNSSASQSRVSTVTFVEEEVAKELHIRLDNGRDMSKKMTPSKLNAYKGLSGSSTRIVSTPRFALVPDYKSPTTFDAHLVTETEWHMDDRIEQKTVTEMFDRFDGQGLISYEMASRWADDLGLDYVPAQWCIRQNYIKGMLCTFDIHKFCKEENDGNYMIKTSYTDENGNPIEVDLRDIDVILSESQFKLWDSFPSIEVYEENCIKNKQYWGVSLYTPKYDKDILTMNYQFVQTLNLNKQDVRDLADKFVKWITSVTNNDMYYTMLFLLGENINEDSVDRLMNKSDKHWVKSLFANPDLINDKYIKRKIHNMIKRRIQKACLGDVIVDGNFQVIVSDPYAQMQHICGQEVTGLLNKGEHYSHYWNVRDVKVVDSMRSPLTYRSEHVLLNLVENEKINEWYRHCYTGIIVNAHGDETVRWAGSDFDYDILATTSDKTVIKGVYKDELPVMYQPPKSEVVEVTEDRLFESDKFGFGSIIGSITNKSTSGYAILSDLDEDSEEYSVTLNRIRMCTKLQSAQIDKAKIGKAVKGIPSSWTKYQSIEDDDDLEDIEMKELQNRIMLDKHPYFFIYLYPDTKRKYNAHYKKYNLSAQQIFGITLDELKSKKRKTPEQLEFLSGYYHYSPVIESDSVMNELCRYIESIDFNIKNIVNSETEVDHKLLMSDSFTEIDEIKYAEIVNTYDEYKKVVGQYISISHDRSRSDFDEVQYRSVMSGYDKFKLEMNKVCSNVEELVNYLIHMFYVEDQKQNKDILWSLYGDQIFKNISKNKEYCYVPVLEKYGDIEYLNKKYELRRVEL